MNDKTVVGLGGLLRAGKDAVADHLVENHGYTKMGMSDPLLEMALVLDPLIAVPGRESKYGRPDGQTTYQRLSTVVERLGYVQAKQYPEVRRFLQKLGTEVGREMIDQNLWVNIAMNRIERIVEDGGRVVVTGIRFENELTLIRQLGGAPVWVQRELSTAVFALARHASESSLSRSDFDYIFENSGTLPELYTMVDDWVHS